GRPKLYKSKLPKSKTQELSNSTVAYSNARGRLPYELVKLVFDSSADFGELEQEQWHGLHTYITDGTYLQLQDTEAIREVYPPIENNGMFPQALLQTFIRQGSGQVSQYSIGSRKESELQLVIPMIKTLKENDLLLADDLYNTFYHFYLIQKQNAHIIVPGKRDRNYTVIKQISPNDEIVEIKKYRRPNYVSKAEWKQIPKCIRLRRISYNYTTNNSGSKSAVLYTTLTDETISAADIVFKYGTRWDIEITIREVKTLMDINVLRSKSPEMLKKELSIALTAYNLVRKTIARSADKADFSPQEDIFQRCVEISRPILLDKKGRVFYRWSPGRYGKTSKTNPQAAHPI
uniref:IS4 family transposase n=1 Tax=Candidatus Symbiothrix dinenymphae TaxID=467085 RepID=UPI000AD262F5